jgi:hypothetical protein
VALSANYYIGEHEAGAMGMISNADSIISDVLHALFGMRKLDEMEKKT